MLSSNTGAGLFYQRLDFHVIDVPGADLLTYYGRATGSS